MAVVVMMVVMVIVVVVSSPVMMSMGVRMAMPVLVIETLSCAWVVGEHQRFDRHRHRSRG